MTKVGGFAEYLAGASVIPGRKINRTQAITNPVGSSAGNPIAVERIASTSGSQNQKEEESLQQFLQRYRNSFFVNKNV